jgi:hypothetical protein
MEYKTPEKDRESSKEYYQDNKERISKYNKEYYQDNKERILKYQMEWKRNNKEKVSEHRKKYNQSNKEKIATYKKEYYQANKERLVKQHKEYKQANKERNKEIRFKWKYNLTLEDMAILLDEQENKCKICSIKFNDDIKYNVDHCHSTGKVRGLLCRCCNLGLGFFKDDPKLLIKAIEYLEVK